MACPIYTNVKNACDYLGLDSVVSKDVSILSKCDKLILPGVGAFQDCMHTLHSMGLYDFIVQQVNKDVALLGICLGMQALFETSEENGLCDGFGFLKGHVCHMEDPSVKFPKSVGTYWKVIILRQYLKKIRMCIMSIHIMPKIWMIKT